ncbi:MAG TPA: thiolase family protein, partial [Asanoa sp.]
LVVAGGVESMTRVPMGSSVAGGNAFGPQVRERYRGRAGFAADDAVPFSQGVGAEMVAERWGFSRTRLDEYALASHEKAAAAQDAGEFDAEISPVVTTHGGKVTADEGVRRDTTLDKLAALKTPFKADGVVTAGTASQISDGAAALAVTTSEWATAHGLRPIARVHTAVVAADDPVVMLTAPMPATAKALRRAGLGIEEIGVYEVNEAFAPVPLAWLAETEADPARLNPRGGAIALGHPLGGSGARIMTTMLHHMRANDIRYGLQTMCEGGGMANATVVELLG